MTIKKLINIMFYSLTLIIMVVVLLSALFGSKDKNGIVLGPFSIFTVLTGSMNPTFDAGSIIITKKTDADKLQVGDILTYKPLGNNNTLVTHRIVRVISDGNSNSNSYSYITRGDANNVDDSSPVSYDAAVGRVIFWANGVGTALLFIRTPRGIAFVCIVVTVLILLSFLFSKLKSLVSH